MKRISFLISLLSVSIFVSFAQFSVNSSGKASIGTFQYQISLPDMPDIMTPYLIENATPIPNYGDTTAMLNIYGVYGTQNCGGFINFGKNDYTSRVKIGELGKTDTNKIWLHGNNGMYLTANDADTICFYDVDKGDYFQFNCDVKTSGLFITSDSRLKKDIQTLSNSIGGLNQITPIRYKFINLWKNNSNTENSDVAQRIKQANEATQTTRYGFLAQDVKEVYPELVKEGADGYLSVDYIGFIPLLVDAVNELQTRVDEQEETIAYLTSLLHEQPAKAKKTKAVNTTDSNDISITTEAKLYQNAPNPFTAVTKIRYELPQNVASAELCIYDMQGKQLRKIEITDRGNGLVSIETERLQPGMYLYSLIADGQEVDTKRMILTD